jgi:hypothetical protein
MEHLISEIEAYADAVGRTPQAVLRAAIDAGGREWVSWRDGRSSPTMARVDRLRAYMASNPPGAGVGREDVA